jgi:hypothetical protein
MRALADARQVILYDVAVPDDFLVGDEHTIYEWCMFYVDLHPRVASTEPTVAGQEDRLRYLGAIPPLVAGSMPDPDHNRKVDIRAHRRISAAIYRKLAKAISTGELESKREAILEDKPDELDPTMCVLDAEPILEIAEHRGDYGETIRRLLIARQVRSGPKAGARSIKGLACEIALRILEDEAQRPPRGRGRLTKLAGLVNAELAGHPHRYQPDSIRRSIGPSVREWEKKHPDQ